MSTITVLEQFGRVRRQINRLCILYLSDLEIGPKQMVLLRFVRRHKKCSMSQIATGVGSDKASVTRMVNSLLQTRYLQSVSSKKDRRHSVVRLGPKAKTIMRRIDRIYARLSKEFVGSLSARERNGLLRSLKKVQPRLQRAIDATLARAKEPGDA